MSFSAPLDLAAGFGLDPDELRRHGSDPLRAAAALIAIVYEYGSSRAASSSHGFSMVKLLVWTMSR